MTEFEKTVKVILETGNQILNTINEKNRNSIGKRSEQISYERLKSFALESQLPIISKFDKEDYDTRKNWNSYWILSPIIGKKNLREQKDDFLIGITKIKKQRPSLVILFAPARNELFIGENNKAYAISNLNPNSAQNRDELLKEENRINKPIESLFFNILKSKTKMNARTENFLSEFKLHKSGAIKETVNDSPMNLIGIAKGKYDFYPHLKSVNEWDIAPFDALITFSGNRVTQKDGILPLEYNTEKLKFPDFIAKNNFDIDGIDLKD